jgi:hypothetical protein
MDFHLAIYRGKDILFELCQQVRVFIAFIEGSGSLFAVNSNELRFTHGPDVLTASSYKLDFNKFFNLFADIRNIF